MFYQLLNRPTLTVVPFFLLSSLRRIRLDFANLVHSKKAAECLYDRLFRILLDKVLFEKRLFSGAARLRNASRRRRRPGVRGSPRGFIDRSDSSWPSPSVVSATL